MSILIFLLFIIVFALFASNISRMDNLSQRIDIVYGITKSIEKDLEKIKEKNV